MATETQEIKIRKALLDFVNQEVVITGEVEAVMSRKYDLVEILFLLHMQFDRYLHPRKIDID